MLITEVVIFRDCGTESATYLRDATGVCTQTACSSPNDAARSINVDATSVPTYRQLVDICRHVQNRCAHWTDHKTEVALTSSANRKEKCCRSVAVVTSKLTLARDCPTQLRGPSAKGK